MAQFSFTFDFFTIWETRSRHRDTDFATLSVGVNTPAGDKSPSLTKSMGNLNNGTFAVNLVFPNVTVNPGDTVYFSYLVVNAGNKPPGQIETLIETAAGKLATAGGAALAGAIIGSSVPVVGTIVGALAGYLTTELESVFTADCDGTVAGEVQMWSYNQLVSMTSGGPFKWETQHPGTNSPHGCGSNSNYYSAWHINAGPPTGWGSGDGGHISTGGGGPWRPTPPHGELHQN